MRLKHFGDSYDIVKQSFLRWLSPLGPWSAHPMFTETVSDAGAAAFAALIGVPLVTTRVLNAAVDRNDYFAVAEACEHHLFLDPDTGVQLKVTRNCKARAYVFGAELVRVAQSRPERLTLVFDQSLARGREREGLSEKLAFLSEHGIHGVTYKSHASFLLLTSDRILLGKARRLLQDDAHLPETRLLGQNAASPE